MPRRLAIVPARGGSKRLPDKNIKPFCGKPMIGHILDAARQSGLFDVVHVSTDDARIAQVAAECGYAPDFARPAELADDHTPLMPVLKWVVEEYQRRGEHFDQMTLLMACAPLIEASDLTGAVELFERAGSHNPVISVAPYPVPVEWAFSLDDDRRLTPAQPGMFAMRSQDLGVKYYDSGCFVHYAATTITTAEGAGDDSAFLGYPIPKSKAVDIDDHEDWALAEMIWHGRSIIGNR